MWGVDAVPATPGKTAVEMFEAVRRGEIKAVWIACTNPAQSMPDQALVREALERAELVVVQEAYANTETCAYADVLLPATSWGEKEGTVTNSERRISRAARRRAAPGEARDDWAIAVDFARRLEARLPPAHLARRGTLFPYSTPEQIFDEHRETTRGRDLDITGLSYALLDRAVRSNGLSPRARKAGRSACTPTAFLRRRVAARASPIPRTSPSPTPSTRAFRFASTPGACATSGTP